MTPIAGASMLLVPFHNSSALSVVGQLCVLWRLLICDSRRYHHRSMYAKICIDNISNIEDFQKTIIKPTYGIPPPSLVTKVPRSIEVFLEITLIPSMPNHPPSKK
jgi:hypothetical protein